MSADDDFMRRDYGRLNASLDPGGKFAEEVAALLRRMAVPHALIGAHARNAYLRPRTTTDIDVFVPREHLDAVAARIRDLAEEVVDVVRTSTFRTVAVAASSLAWATPARTRSSRPRSSARGRSTSRRSASCRSPRPRSSPGLEAMASTDPGSRRSAVAATEAELIRFGIGQNERARLGLVVMT